MLVPFGHHDGTTYGWCFSLRGEVMFVECWGKSPCNMASRLPEYPRSSEKMGQQKPWTKHVNQPCEPGAKIFSVPASIWPLKMSIQHPLSQFQGIGSHGKIIWNSFFQDVNVSRFPIWSIFLPVTLMARVPISPLTSLTDFPTQKQSHQLT